RFALVIRRSRGFRRSQRARSPAPRVRRSLQDPLALGFEVLLQLASRASSRPGGASASFIVLDHSLTTRARSRGTAARSDGTTVPLDITPRNRAASGRLQSAKETRNERTESYKSFCNLT